MHDANPRQKHDQQRAYGIYVRLQWLLYQLPADHPAWSHVERAVVQADRHWRDLTPAPHLDHLVFVRTQRDAESDTVH